MPLNGVRPTLYQKGVLIKHCYRCRRFYDRDGFYRNVTKADGLSDECRSCAKELASITRDRNRALNYARRAVAT